MPYGLDLLNCLDDKDVDWILSISDELQLQCGDLIIEEGSIPSALCIVQSGVAKVTNRINHEDIISMIGPGELLGEISFIDGRPASASVTAVEDMTVLSIPRVSLEERITGDSSFASRFYLASSSVMAERLRKYIASAEPKQADDATGSNEVNDFWNKSRDALRQFKDLLQEADNLAIKHGGNIPEDISTVIREKFDALLRYINEQIGDASSIEKHNRERIGAQLQRELLPYVLLTDSAERWYSKPRGYAGDFLAIEHMYQNKESGKGRIGALIDRCFLDSPPVKAARNRRGLLKREIQKVLDARGNEVAHVASMACGPAEEIFDVFRELDDPSNLMVNVIDIDLQALAFVVDRRDQLRLQSRIIPHNANLIHLAIGKQKLNIEPQDLIYSIGLIDYFEDKFVVRLMNYGYKILKPGGKMILGNFHPRNPSKAFMDYILDWKLIHRTEEDMNRLYEQSSFGRPCTSIEFEEEGINLFASCIR